MTKLVKNQSKTFTKTVIDSSIDNNKVDIVVSIRHDDRCGNGHNSFSITGDVYKHGRRKDRSCIMAGCIHEVIEKHFPELSHLIKWHLCSTDSPLHYIANTLYHCRTCSHEGKKVGEPVSFETRLKFEGFPLTFSEKKKGFFEWITDRENFDDVEVVEVPKKDDSHIYSSNWTLSKFVPTNPHTRDPWYDALFNDKNSAIEFLDCLQNFKAVLVKIPTKYAVSVEPNLDAARDSAIWPEATLEQLQDKQLLQERLPTLMAEFRKDIESLGFIY